jgi:hypothetical protein
MSKPARYRVTVHRLHDGTTTKVLDIYASAFITAVTTVTSDSDGDIAEVHLNDSGPYLQQYTAQAVADQYLPSKRHR